MGKRSDSFLGLLYQALFLFTPLIVVPWASELFEINKMLFVLFLATIVGLVILNRLLRRGKWVFGRTPWDIPLLVFLFGQVLSTFFSIDRHVSIWGYYSRFHGGLLSTIAYLTLYFGLTSFMATESTQAKSSRYQKVEFLLRTILASAFLVAVYGFLQHPNPLFRHPDNRWRGIDADRWIQDVQERVFSTLGQPNWLAAYLAMTIPISWFFLLESTPSREDPPKTKVPIKTILLFALEFAFSLLMFWVLVFTKSRAGLIGLGAGLSCFLLITFSARRLLQLKISSLSPLFLLVGGYLGILLISGRPLLGRFGAKISLDLPIGSKQSASPEITRATQAAKPTTTPPLPQTAPIIPDDTGKIRAIVWQGALNIFRHYPIFGSGVETFAYSYWQFRPVAHNLTSEWEFLYNKAHNEYLNVLATTGLVGLASYSLLVLVYLGWTLKQVKRARVSESAVALLIQISLLAGFISGLVANFWGFSVVVVGLLFFLYPALSYALAEKHQTLIIKVNLGRFSRLAQLTLLAIFVYLILILGKIFVADLLYAHGTSASQLGDYQTAYRSLKLASYLRVDEPVYHDSLAFTASILATTSAEVEQASQLATEAVEESQTALAQGLVNVNYWKTAARVFSDLGSLDPSVYNQALLAIEQAEALAPTDPKLPYNRGLILLEQAMSDDPDLIKEVKDGKVVPEEPVQKALEAFRFSLELKPDYRDGHFALAVTEHELAVDDTGTVIDQDRLNQALEQLKIMLKTTSPPDYEAGQKLKEWTRLL